MKWCFLIDEFVFFKEFWWRIASQVVKDGDECVFFMDGKIAEYGKKDDFLQQGMKFLSKVDWCIEKYDPNQKDFGGLTWKEFFPDFTRYIPSTFNYQNSMEITSQLYQFLDFAFKTEKPDVVIGGCPANLFEQVAYYFAGEYKVPWLALTESILGENRIDVHDLEHTNSQFEPTFKHLQKSDISESELKFARDYIENFLSHKQMPAYMRGQDVHGARFKLFRKYFRRIKKLNEKWKILFRYLRNRKSFKKYDYRSDIVFKQFIRIPLEDIKRQLRIFFQKHLFKSYNKDDVFFLYPLHFQPEFTTSVLATYYSDQAATVNNIAFALPFPYKLYVKEHPSSPGTRPSEFYKKLNRIPNVVLIPAKERVENLIKKSAGVITLTGTVGMEAAFTGKPVYVLGKVFYMYHPLCRKIDNFDDLRKRMQDDIANKPNTTDLEDINLRFIISYFRNTIAGSTISGARDNDINNYKALCQDLKNILKITKN